MVEIRYGDNYEVADLAGQTLGEARANFKAEFGIPDKARAKLNGKKVGGRAESEITLNDDDKLSFAEARGKGAYLVGAMLLALAVTGGVFAYGWINATTTLDATAATSDFAAVTENSSDALTWTPYGFFKGSISGPKPIFDVDTVTSNYSGDLVVTVSLANADELVKCYRVLALKIEMVETDNTSAVIEINEDVDTDNNWALLTLGNGEVNMFPGGTAQAMTVRVKSGFYITHIFKGANWGSSYEDPVLFCEVAQR